jgi:predicted TIM-barrel fold metal-dependent hydrolase
MKSWSKPSCSPPLFDERPASGESGLSGLGLVDGVIDAHAHIFSPQMIAERSALAGRDAWFALLYDCPTARMSTAAELVAAMDRDGVARTVVFGFAFNDQGLCRESNDYVLEAVMAYPDRLSGLCCVSPGMPGAVAELERCLDAGMRGCGELAPDGQGFGDAFRQEGVAAVPARACGVQSGFAAVAACLQERDLPLLVHSNEPVGHRYRGKGRFAPKACLALAAAYPELTIVYAHMGGGLVFYELMPEVRQTLARVHYDTSAVPYLYAPAVYGVAAACAGADKLLFGSDYPLLPVTRYREGLATLDDGSRAAVLGDNARRVYRL